MYILTEIYLDLNLVNTDIDVIQPHIFKHSEILGVSDTVTLLLPKLKEVVVDCLNSYTDECAPQNLDWSKFNTFIKTLNWDHSYIETFEQKIPWLNNSIALLSIEILVNNQYPFQVDIKYQHEDNKFHKEISWYIHKIN